MDDMSLRTRVGCLAMLKIVVLTIGAFFRTVRFVVVPRYPSARIQYESDRIGVIGLSGCVARLWR